MVIFYFIYLVFFFKFYFSISVFFLWMDNSISSPSSLTIPITSTIVPTTLPSSSDTNKSLQTSSLLFNSSTSLPQQPPSPPPPLLQQPQIPQPQHLLPQQECGVNDEQGTQPYPLSLSSPQENLSDPVIYVNPKQCARILKRRIARNRMSKAMASFNGTIVPASDAVRELKKVAHQKRHQQASKRKRNASGKFI